MESLLRRGTQDPSVRLLLIGSGHMQALNTAAQRLLANFSTWNRETDMLHAAEKSINVSLIIFNKPA